MEYKTTAQMAEQWGVSDRRIRILCQEGKIEGAAHKGRAWMIPADTMKPTDGRSLRYKQNHSPYAQQLAEIDAKRADLDHRRPLTQEEFQQLRDTFLAEYTYNSNAIEGNTLTLEETALVLEGVTIDKKPLKEHLEAVGHRDAFLYIEELAKGKIPFSEHVIKQIHTLVLMDHPEDRGIYRRIPVQITGAYHTPTDPVMVPEQMEQLLIEFRSNKQLHPIECAARFHLKFEGIHPFVYGNSRTGRLILNLMLMQAGYPPINIKYTDRPKYYEAFDTFYRAGDAGAMTEILLQEVKKQLNHLLQIRI